jgi:hypothetical protein
MDAGSVASSMLDSWNMIQYYHYVAMKEESNV